MKKTLLLLAAGIILTLFVVNLFGLSEVVAALAQANPLFIAAALAVQLAALALYAIRVRIIGGGFLSFGKAFRVAMSGNLVSLVTPVAKIGGEPLKIYMLRDNYGSSKAAAVIAIDDVVDIIAGIVIVLLTGLLFVPSIVPSMAGVFAIFLVVSVALLLLIIKLLMSPRLLKKMVDWLLDKISKHPEKKVDHVRMFYEYFRSMLLNRKATLGVVMLVTFGIKVLEFVVIWLAFASIGVIMPWHEVVLLWSIILVFLFIPWLPGSLGLVEFGASSALIGLGMTSAAAATGTLINRFASLWFVLIVGIIALYAARKRGELPSTFGLDSKKPKI